MLTRFRPAQFLPFMGAMAFIVVLSNFLVQFPVEASLGGLNLADLLTWGAFTYPAAFLITDLTNSRFGTGGARRVVLVGFVVAVGLSFWLATPRIAIASGTAFFMAQMLDVSVFDRLRGGIWWRGPLVSSVLGSILDTMLFFSLAFGASFSMLGSVDGFVGEMSPLLGIMEFEAPRWVSWAMGDFAVKMLVALAMLVPYGILRHKIGSRAVSVSS